MHNFILIDIRINVILLILPLNVTEAPATITDFNRVNVNRISKLENDPRNPRKWIILSDVKGK